MYRKYVSDCIILTMLAKQLGGIIHIHSAPNLQDCSLMTASLYPSNTSHLYLLAPEPSLYVLPTNWVTFHPSYKDLQPFNMESFYPIHRI